jgi:formyltetrahydrofolate deformylase
MSPGDQGRLLIKCPDGPGIVAAVSAFFAERGANIVESDQYSTDPEGGTFFLRLVFHMQGLGVALPELEREFAAEIAARFGMEWRVAQVGIPKRAALMVSREDHCLLDLLWRTARGQLPIDIGVVVSNHGDLAEQVRNFRIPYVHIPVPKGGKAEAESQQLDVLGGNFDVVVLARYMQILSGDFLERVGCPVINIHHSFLPAFAGAGPYERAKERGVKLIGATAHYVTEELDEGPIIEQDVIRVTHRESALELARRGADVERTVLARAVAWHCDDRVLRHGNTTVAFV